MADARWRTPDGGRPIQEGFEANVTFFRLNYLDPDRVDMGQQFAAIAPLLWLQSGGIGPCEGDEAKREPGFSLPEGARYGVLFRESAIRPFLAALQERPDVTHVYLVTNRADSYAQMRAALSPGIQTRRLYRDYLKSFRIGGPSEKEAAQ